MPIIPVNKVAGKKRIIGKRRLRRNRSTRGADAPRPPKKIEK
jgi:hypothetical protein